MRAARDVAATKVVRQRTRGEYRPIYGVLLDDADFQQLSANARLTMLTVKISLGAAGIGVLYSGQLAARTGLSAESLETALGELDTGGWIKRERNVVWLVNGLRFEPAMSPDSPTQRRHIQRHVAGLPGLTIITAFRERYPGWFVGEDATSATAQAIATPSDSPSHTPSRAYGIGSGGGGGIGRSTSRRQSADEPKGFSEAWAEYPKREGNNSRRKAARAYAARLRGGVAVADLLAGVRRYRAFCEAKGWVGGPYVQLASTFFGPDQHYAESWTVAADPAGDSRHVMEPEEYDAYLVEETARVRTAQAKRDAERAGALP